MSTLRSCLAPDCQNTHSNRKYCSVQCRVRGQTIEPPHKPRLTQEETIEIIQLYQEKIPVEQLAQDFSCGLNTIYRCLKKADIPLMFFHRGSHTTRNKKDPSEQTITEIKFLYGFGFSAKHIAEQLGIGRDIILRILRESYLTRKGFDPFRRISTIDGHLVRSSAELVVDDWLYNHGIVHIYEPKLTIDPHYHADFLACGYYIELWGGGPNQKSYKQTMTKKLALYAAHNLPLISITWEQTPKDLDTVLAPLLTTMTT